VVLFPGVKRPMCGVNHVVEEEEELPVLVYLYYHLWVVVACCRSNFVKFWKCVVLMCSKYRTGKIGHFGTKSCCNKLHPYV
jgi:hypothetical protein